MKMISSTSSTSISGVTLISAFRPPVPPSVIAMASSSCQISPRRPAESSQPRARRLAYADHYGQDPQRNAGGDSREPQAAHRQERGGVGRRGAPFRAGLA